MKWIGFGSTDIIITLSIVFSSVFKLVLLMEIIFKWVSLEEIRDCT